MYLRQKKPGSVAVIHCVGSRDEKTNRWCSRVCCMYAIKETLIAMEHVPELDASIFFMDMRTFGKDYEEFYNRTRKKGINFYHGRVKSIQANDGKLRVTDMLLYGALSIAPDLDLLADATHHPNTAAIASTPRRTPATAVITQGLRMRDEKSLKSEPKSPIFSEGPPDRAFFRAAGRRLTEIIVRSGPGSGGLAQRQTDGEHQQGRDFVRDERVEGPVANAQVGQRIRVLDPHAQASGDHVGESRDA